MEQLEKITPENLLDNLPNIGSYSSYYLATYALEHYFPDEDDKTVWELMDELNCEYWQDVIKKYHKEKGYPAELLSNKKLVNKH